MRGLVWMEVKIDFGKGQHVIGGGGLLLCLLLLCIQKI